MMLHPQDSFAEISRLAGRFNDSLEHYRASLKIDPTFIDSQAGLGDTYAVMGEEEKARAEYDIAIARATTRVESVAMLQHAATWAREQNFPKPMLSISSWHRLRTNMGWVIWKLKPGGGCRFIRLTIARRCKCLAKPKTL